MTRLAWAGSAAAVAVVAIAVRVLFLGERQLFRDEAASWLESSYPLPQLLEVAQGEPYPPLYAVSMHFWMMLAGDSEAALRAFSVLTGLVMVALGWRWAHEALGRWPGLVAAIVLALSPLAVANAREVRMYALESAFVTAGWWLTWRLLSGRVTDRSALVVHGAGLAMAVAGAAWTLVLGLVTGGLQGLVSLGALVAGWVRHDGASGSGSATAAAGGPAVSGEGGPAVAVVAISLGGLTFLPWLPGMLELASSGQPFWTPVPQRFDWAVSLGAALLGPWESLPLFVPLRAILLGLASGGVAGLLLSGERARSRLGWCLLAGLALPLLVWAISQFRSIYDTRYLGAAVAPLALAIAAGIEVLARRGMELLPRWRPHLPETAAAGVVALLVVPMAAGLGGWLSDWRSERGLNPARQLVAAVAPRLMPGDVVLTLDARTYFPFAYAAHRLAVEGRPLPAPVLDWNGGAEPFYRGQSLIPPERVIHRAEVQEAGGWSSLPGLEPGGSIWLVSVSHGDRPDLGFGPLANGELQEMDRIMLDPAGETAQARRLLPSEE